MASKHVIKDASREHVISWIGTDKGVIRRCSCPACEINAVQALSRSEKE